MARIKTLTLVFLIAATSVAQENCLEGDKRKLGPGLLMLCDVNNNWVPIVKGRAKPGAPPCEDSISADQCEADRGHCSQYTEAGQKMDVTCPGTCESCDGCRCQDSSQWYKYCPYWAQYCGNPGVLGTWMTTNCSKTCNKCKCNCCSYKGKSHNLGQRIPLPDQCGELVCEEGLVAEDSPLLPGAVQHDVSHPEEVTLVFRSLHAGADCCLLENDTMVPEGWSGELIQNGSSFQGICCHGVLSMPIKDITIRKPPTSTSTTPTTSTTTMAPTITTTLTTTTTIITGFCKEKLEEFLCGDNNADDSSEEESKEACSRRCYNTPTCVAWTFGSLSPPRNCWLKTTSDCRVAAPGTDWTWGTRECYDQTG